MSQPHVDDDINCFNNTNPPNNFQNNSTVAAQKSEILAWLSGLEPSIQHQDIQAHRADGVGDWLLQTEEYQNWLGGIPGKSDSSALLCYGGPGAGKTYISSLVIDTLCEKAVKEKAAVGYFYFNFTAQEEQSPAAVLGLVLKQVVRELDGVPEKIVKAFQDGEKVIGGQRITVSKIVELFKDISSSRFVFICIDALDECQAEYRAKLLDSLNQILRGCSGARIYLTGRPRIRTEVEKYLDGRLTTTSITPTEDDIAAFIRSKLREGTIPDAMDLNLEETTIRDILTRPIRAKLREGTMPDAMARRSEEETIQDIPETISDIFPLVSLNVQAARGDAQGGLRSVRKPRGLDPRSAYCGMLGRIKAQGEEKARLGMAALMWIAHSERPLKVDEIRHALAIQTGSNDFNNNNIPPISILQRYCLELIAIDKDTSTVRLIHYTLKEYIFTHPNLFDRAHSTMAEICLTYLNFQHVKDLSPGLSPDPRGTPFLEYSSLYWGTHMRKEVSDLTKTLAFQLLDQFDNHISAKSLWNSISWELTSSPAPNREPFSALHCISYFGIPEVANTLKERFDVNQKGRWDVNQNRRWDVNQRDSAGMTPLIWAAKYGHEEMVGWLLRQKHIQPDLQDTNYGRAALSWAAGNGHEGVVRLLLGPRFVNPESIGRQWGKVWRAAGQLFGRGYVNPNSAGEYGKTPLVSAVENGHGGVVKLLLERRDINPNSSDRSGRTPLLWAARNGNEGAVRQLLERKDVNPDIPDAGYYRTPLSWAAGNGHEEVVKLLLKRKDVNHDDLAESGRTPLLWAAENGHEGVVEVLLQQDVNSNIQGGEYGQTPLSRAAQNGHVGVVRLLLERNDINPDIRDIEFGRTPLSWAAGNGHEGVVGLLLEREGVNPESASKSGRTPLWLAAANGHGGIVKLLLKRRDANPDIAETSYGQTPLSRAAQNGREGVVKLLLGRNDINPDTRDSKFGRTPLSWAAGNGHEGIVKLLLCRDDVRPDTRDTEFHRTPLSWAAGNGHEGIVELLLGRASVNPHSSGKSRRTPLLWAAENGHEGIVKLLLEQIHVNPDTPDSVFRQTPLLWAARNGHKGIVELLLEREGVDPNSTSKSGQTPLTLAAERGHDRIVELLRARQTRHIK